jgi:hypothetical protein
MRLRSPPTVHTNVQPWHLRQWRDEAFAVLAEWNEIDRSAAGALEVARLVLNWCEYLARRDFPSSARQAWSRAAEAIRELLPDIEDAAEAERGSVH